MKKALALGMALALLLCVCGFAQADSAAPRISEDLIEVTAAGPFGLKIEYEEILTWKEWQDRLGIKFIMNFYNSEDWKTQFNLMLASDDLPDIIFSSGLSSAEVADLGSQGYFVNFLDYEGLIPNIKQGWADNPGLRGAMTSYDGGVYGTRAVVTSTVNKICRSFINKNWLENMGLEKPKTIDELYDALTVFKAQDANGNGDPNDEIPLGFYASGGTGDTEKVLLEAFGINSNATQYMLQADGDKAYLADTTENYRAYLSFMQKLVAEGLIDSQCFTLTSQEVMHNCQLDRYGMYATGSAPYVMTTTPIATDKNWLGIMGLTSELNQTPTLGIPSGIVGFGTHINAESSYIKELVQFVDYLHTDEGGTATFSGYEGVTFDYEYDELLGIDVLTIYSPEGYASSDEFRQYKAVFNGPFLTWSGIPVRNTIWYDVPLETLQQDAVIEKYGWIAQLTIASRDPALQHVPMFPAEALSYTAAETEDRVGLNTDITSYLKQAKANFMLGTWNLQSDWDAYLLQLEAMGLSRLMDIEQAAWTRYQHSGN